MIKQVQLKSMHTEPQSSIDYNARIRKIRFFNLPYGQGHGQAQGHGQGRTVGPTDGRSNLFSKMRSPGLVPQGLQGRTADMEYTAELSEHPD